MTRTTHAFASTLFGAGMALLASTAPAAAQDATYLPKAASHCDVFRGLSKVIPGHCASEGERALAANLGTTRSIRVHGESGASATPASVTTTSTSAPPPSEAPANAPPSASNASTEVDAIEQSEPPKDLSIAMRIQFAYDSFRLTGQAKRALDRVAGVLQDDLMRDEVVEIAGHADASGPERYNLELSQQRARAVRAYLIERHDVAAERLPYVGKGESQPFDSSDPYNGINRRVEFHNLTG